MNSDADVAVPSRARRLDDGLSRIVARGAHDPLVLARWLSRALVAYVAIHYIGLYAGLGQLGQIHRFKQAAAALGLDQHVGNHGEMEPLGTLEELITVLVTTLLVAMLTGAVRDFRARHVGDDRFDALPPQLWRVAVIALFRPRKVIEELWHRSARIDAERSVRGGMLIDVLWPVWLLTGAAIRLGDHLSARATTLSSAQVATWIEVVAEAGFVLLGSLLFCLTIVISGRLRAVAAGTSAPPVPSRLMALAGISVIAVPVGGALLIGSYSAGTRGPSIAEMRVSADLDRVWQAREHAIVALDEPGLRRATTGPALDADLDGFARRRRTGRRVRWEREASAAVPVSDATHPTVRVVGVTAHGAPSWTTADPAVVEEVVVLTRARAAGAWRVALEVPLAPAAAALHGMRAMPVEATPEDVSLLAGAIRTSLPRRGRPALRVTTAVTVPLQQGRFVCGAAVTRTSRPRVIQACAGQLPGGAPMLAGRNLGVPRTPVAHPVGASHTGPR